MPDTKISALTDGSTAVSTDRIPVARSPFASGDNRYITPGYIKTATIGAGSVSIASGKTFTASNTLTLAGTDSTTITFGSASSSFPIVTSPTAATLQLGAADTSASATVTITIATPGVVTWSSHGLSTGTPVVFSTTGALPTGITAGTTYYAIVVDINTFQIATSYANATAVSPTAVNTSGSQSGTHTGTRGAVDQVFRVQSASGTANFPGADFAIQGSRGTGTGAGGSIIFQVAPAGSSGTAQNAYSTALTINSNGKATFKPTVNSTSTFEITNLAGSIIVEVDSTNRRFNAGGSGGAFSVSTSTGATTLYNAAYFGWQDDATASSGTTDVRLYRDAPNTLALRNGTNAQRFNVYNTYTSSTNYETFKIDWITTANTCLIGTEKGSSGTARALALQTDGTTRLTIATGGDVSVANSLICNNVTNSSSAAYSDSIIFYPAGFASYFSKIKARINGSGTASTAGLVFAINAATSSSNDAFWMLGNQVFAFGGDTSSFPGLKRSGSTTTLQVRLADDSAFGSFQTGGFSGGAPTIKTANYTQLEADYSLIFNGTGSITLTLLAAATYPGKILYVKTIAAQTVVSASSNVKPIDTDTAGTAILAATAGKWAMLQSDGTNWVIMAQG